MSDDRYEHNLFEICDDEGKKTYADPLNVVNAKFLKAERKGWIDLFEGYTELYAITYSSSVEFTAELSSHFGVYCAKKGIASFQNRPGTVKGIACQKKKKKSVP